VKLVLDTSVIAKVFIDEGDHSLAVSVLDGAIASKEAIIAPSLMLYELNNVFVKNRMLASEYNAAVADVMYLVGNGHLVIREPDTESLRHAAEIAAMDTRGQGHISSFDATFHALAIMEGATLVTADANYVRKTQTLVGHVVLLSEFKP
jgi:predicted nucleic acid-binding protein